MADENEHGKFSSRIKKALDATKAKARKFFHEVDWVFGRRTVRVLCAVALFAIVVALLLVFLDWYIAPTKASDKKDLVLALAQILAGTALLSGLYFTWRTLQVNREGQITERFTRSIEQLGATRADNNKNLELRLGGIYALERIANESEKDHWSIMEVLTAYVRQHARGRDASVEKPKGEFEPTSVPFPDLEIQAIMTVIRQRTRSLGNGEPEPLDLHETNLTRANLTGADLTGADLTGAILSKVLLWGAILSEETTLYNADIRGADLSEAHLSGAIHLEAARGDKNTSIPDHFERPESWGVRTDTESG